jgi:hypothetical protein
VAVAVLEALVVKQTKVLRLLGLAALPHQILFLDHQCLMPQVVEEAYINLVVLMEAMVRQTPEMVVGVLLV